MIQSKKFTAKSVLAISSLFLAACGSDSGDGSTRGGDYGTSLYAVEHIFPTKTDIFYALPTDGTQLYLGDIYTDFEPWKGNTGVPVKTKIFLNYQEVPNTVLRYRSFSDFKSVMARSGETKETELCQRVLFSNQDLQKQNENFITNDPPYAESTGIIPFGYVPQVGELQKLIDCVASVDEMTEIQVGNSVNGDFIFYNNGALNAQITQNYNFSFVMNETIDFYSNNLNLNHGYQYLMQVVDPLGSNTELSVEDVKDYFRQQNYQGSLFMIYIDDYPILMPNPIENFDALTMLNRLQMIQLTGTNLVDQNSLEYQKSLEHYYEIR